MYTQSFDERFRKIEEQMSIGNKAEALDAFRQSVCEGVEHIASFIQYLLATNQIDTAEKLMLAVKEYDSVWLEVARCMLALVKGDAKAARRHASRAIAGGADENIIYNTVAQAMEALGLYDRAINYYVLAQRSEKSFVRLLNIIRLLILKGEIATAEKIVSSLPQEAGKEIVQSFEVILACARQDKEKAYALVAALDPNDSVLSAAAILAAKMHGGEKDLQDLAYALAQLELSPTDILAAQAYIQCNDIAKAVTVLDRAAADEYTTTQEMFYIAQFYLQIGRYDSALAAFEKADDGTLPRKFHYFIQASRGKCAHEMGKKREAMAIYQQLLIDVRNAMMEGYTDTDLYLVQLHCYKSLGNKEKMKELYEFSCLIAADDETRQLLRAVVEN